MTLRVYGRSDDLVLIEGSVQEEFNVPYPEQRLFLTFSNGVVLFVEYSAVGEWNVTELHSPSDVNVEVHSTDWRFAPVDYSETAIIEGGGAVKWVVTGRVMHSFGDRDGDSA